MAKFSPKDAVFAGFRFIRARPATLLIWSAYLMVVLTVAYLALRDLGGEQITALVAAAQSNAPNFKQISELIDGLQPASAFSFLLILVFGAVLVTAILRAYLQPAPHAWGGLRLGGEELRVLGIGVLMVLAVMAAEALVVLVAASIGQVGGPAVSILALGLGYLGVMGLAVRLSLAPVIAMVDGKMSLRRSWLMTRKAFWRMLGAYILLTAIMIVVLLLVMMAFGGLIATAAAATGSGVEQLMFALQHNYQDINPLILALYVVMNLAQVWVAVMFITVSLALGVEVYKAYAPETPN